MGKKHSATTKCPSELEERAVRMVLDLQRQDPIDHGFISRVACQVGMGTESLWIWVKQNRIDSGARQGLSTEERAELVELRKKNRELVRANDILQAAAIFFGAELDRRHKR